MPTDPSHPSPPATTIVAPRLFDGTAWHDNVTVDIANGRIAAVTPSARRPADNARLLPAGAILAPGFIDLQVNGGGGALLNDEPTAATVRTMLAAHRRFGTTGFLPTLITDSREALAALAAAAAEIAGIPGVLGLHLEGPFLNKARKGVHPEPHVRSPDTADIAFIEAIAGRLPLLVTLAPECVPAGFIAWLVANGIKVAVGHSNATAAEMQSALAEGATAVTHLFNAMSQLSPREPGIVGTAFDESRIVAGLICDGVHVAPANMRTAFKAAGVDRLFLVTDAMPSLGSASPTFDLQGRTITLAGGRLTAPDGTLAGAHLGMIGAVRNATAMIGVPLGDALIMASRTPARFLGIDRERGCIAAGAHADLVAFDARFDVIANWIAGQAH